MKKISHYTNETLKIELELGEVEISSEVDEIGRRTTTVRMFPRYKKGGKRKRVTITGYYMGAFARKFIEFKTVAEDGGKLNER